MNGKNALSILIAALSTAALVSCFEDDPAAPGPGDGDTTPGTPLDTLLIVDHTCCDISAIPRSAIEDAIDNLVIAYGHTSHGSQLVTGMDGLAAFLGDDLYSWSYDGSGGTLELRDNAMPYDLGYASWEPDTRAYLNSHPEVNVIIWSWCGQVSSASESYIDNYLSLMDGLESDYPDVVFVYMTGHLDGGGEDGNLHIRNEQIRAWCRDNDRVLYDFADIESYDPDGVYYLPRDANDNCDYDSDANGTRDRNWAIDWQNAHPGEWYPCDSAHSQPLNANLKAYAAWYLWARLGGWDGQ
jgi:hypothetical protein